MRVKDIPKEYVLIQDSQEVKSILESMGINEEEFDFLFVKADEGEYEAIYGGFNIPYLDGLVYKVL